MLRLGRLRLRNVRSYASAEVEFGPGVTVLAGDVGSGKTSLLHAVEMALFGFAEVEGPYLVRHRSSEASVSLTLVDDAHTYELARTFRRKTRRGREVFDPEEPTFRLDGELRRYSATEFRQRVIELLGFPDNPNPRSRSDLWRWAVYTPQERMREILGAAEADARLETIRKALGLERYRHAADNAEVVAAAVRAESRSHADVALGMRHFDSDLAAAETALTEARTDANVRQAAAADARRVATEMESLLSASESDRRRREADRRQRDLLVGEEARAQKDAESAGGRLEAARRVLTERERSSEAAAVPVPTLGERRAALERAEVDVLERKEARHRLETASQKLHAAEAAVATVSRSIEEHRAAGEREDSELARAETELVAARARGPSHEPIAPTPRSLDELAADLVALRTNEQAALQSWSSTHAEVLEIASLLAAGICPRCHQSVAPTEFRAHQAEADSAAREAEGTLARIRGQVGELEAERSARERFERDRHSWIAQEELRTAAALAVDRARRRREEGASTLGRLRSEWEAASVDLSHAREDVAPLQDGANLLAHAERRREEARISVVEGERAEALRQSLRDAAEAARAQVELETDRFRELDERRTDLRSRRVALEEALRGAEEGDRAHAELLARRDAARALELETHAGLSTAEDRVRAAEALRVKAAAGAEERRHHVGTAETLARVAAFLNPTFRDALLDLERRLLGRAQAMFERTFSRSFSALVEDPGLLARCGPSFVPYAEIDGEYTPAEALSGGERTALALAFRLALGEVVRSTSRLRLDTIILDEPTDGFSPEQVGRMGELFESLPWGQVIVVTHEVGLGAIADRAVRVRKTAGGSVLEGAGVAESVERAPAPPTRRRRRTGALPMGVPSAK